MAPADNASGQRGRSPVPVDRGIWALWYDVSEADRSEYLEWFHRVHIPEKLSRPGYLWAAHYELGHGGS